MVTKSRVHAAVGALDMRHQVDRSPAHSNYRVRSAVFYNARPMHDEDDPEGQIRASNKLGARSVAGSKLYCSDIPQRRT
jgi:hypothetical protein